MSFCICQSPLLAIFGIPVFASQTWNIKVLQLGNYRIVRKQLLPWFPVLGYIHYHCSNNHWTAEALESRSDHFRLCIYFAYTLHPCLVCWSAFYSSEMTMTFSEGQTTATLLPGICLANCWYALGNLTQFYLDYSELFRLLIFWYTTHCAFDVSWFSWWRYCCQTMAYTFWIPVDAASSMRIDLRLQG